MAASTSALAATVWSYAQTWIARCTGLLFFLVLARLLGPADFGAFAIAALVLALAETVFDQGLATALIQREQLRQSHLDAAFWGALAMGLLLALGAAGVARPLARWFDKPLIATLMLALAPVFLLMALTLLPAAKLRRDLNYQGLARRALWANLLAGGAAVLVAAQGLGAWAFVANQWTYQTISLVVLWRSESRRPRWRFSASCFLELFEFSSRACATRVLDYAEARALEFWVAQHLGLGALGQYHFASRNAQAGQQLVAGPVWDSALGILSRLQAQDQLLKEHVLRLLTASAWIAFPPLAFAVATAPILVPLLFGEKWQASVGCLQILLALVVLRTPLFLLGVAMQARGFAGTSLELTALRVACALAVVLVFLPRDPGAAGRGLFSVQGLNAVFVLAAARSRLGLPMVETCGALLAPVVFCAAGAALVAVAMQQLVWRGWALLLALGVAYTFLWALLALPVARRLRTRPSGGVRSNPEPGA